MGKRMAGLFNQTLKGLRITTMKTVSEEVAMEIAKTFLKQIDDKKERAYFVDYIFNNYTIAL